MRHFVRLFLFSLIYLALAAASPAQKYFAHPSIPNSIGGTGGHHRDSGGYDNGYAYAGSSYGYGYGHQTHHGHGSAFASEAAVSYAHGEPGAMASAYVDYDKALVLGKQMIEEQAHPSAEPSLGEIARELRASANAISEAKLSAIQSGDGQMVICRGSGPGCS